MKFVSTRELRNRPGFVRELVQKEDLVLTADGKPIAILLGIEEDDLEETALIIRQTKAQRAVARMRRQAGQNSRVPTSARAIDTEIQAVRRKRKSV